MPGHSETRRKRQRNLLVCLLVVGCFFLILSEVTICFLCHPHVSGGLIHYICTLVAVNAAIDFKGLWLRLKYITVAFIPGRPLHNTLQR